MGQQEPQPEATDAPQSAPRRSRFRVGAVLAVAAAAGVGAWAVVSHRDSDSSSASTPAAAASETSTATPTAKPIAPVGLSAKGLRTLTASISQPIYWAGPRPGYL